MSRPADSGRHRKLRQRNTPAARAPCVICGSPSEWSHHVAGHANAPKITVRVCRSHADMLDAFLSLAGVKLKHGERSAAELAWATFAGLDGLRAARDGKPGLSPLALAAVRLLATDCVDVRGPRPAAADARHRRNRRPVAGSASFEAARVRAMHDLLLLFPAAAQGLSDLLGLLDDLACNPDAFEVFERLDPEAVEPLYADFEEATLELLDAWRAANAGEPDAQAAVERVARRFGRAAHSIAEHIEHTLANSAGHSREAST
jgi:hypothetical protein